MNGHAVRPVIAANAVPVQTGFVTGRNFVDNLWHLDAELCIMSAAGAEQTPPEAVPPLLNLLDRKMALPRVSQQCLAALAASEPHGV